MKIQVGDKITVVEPVLSYESRESRQLVGDVSLMPGHIATVAAIKCPYVRTNGTFTFVRWTVDGNQFRTGIDNSNINIVR